MVVRYLGAVVAVGGSDEVIYINQNSEICAADEIRGVKFFKIICLLLLIENDSFCFYKIYFSVLMTN